MHTLKLNKINPIKITIFTVLFCTYIFPLGLIDQTYVLSKGIFIAIVFPLYVLTLDKIKIKEIFFILIIIVFFFATKNFNFLLFLSLPFLNKNIKYKDSIIKYLKESKILYVCLFFTIIYSFIFSGYKGRYAFTAIKEINQSGLAIFCLALMLAKKNKFLSNLTLIFGFLTLSRSYILACALYFVSIFMNKNRKYVSKVVIKNSNYLNVTIISSLVLILFGIFYIQQYKLGNIYYSDNLSEKFFNLLDLSNFFRFSAVINLLNIYRMFPSKILFGITGNEYIKYSAISASNLKIPSSHIVPHNLFFSHLKIYGIFSVFETIYVLNILKQIVNKKNYFIYIAIVLYSIILGAGLYSYWLYLSSYVLIINGEMEDEHINN